MSVFLPSQLQLNMYALYQNRQVGFRRDGRHIINPTMQAHTNISCLIIYIDLSDGSDKLINLVI